MRFYARLFLVAALATVLSAPVSTATRAAQQTPAQAQGQMFDQYVARARRTAYADRRASHRPATASRRT
jgi:hypothetical protein